MARQTGFRRVGQTDKVPSNDRQSKQFVSVSRDYEK